MPAGGGRVPDGVSDPMLRGAQETIDDGAGRGPVRTLIGRISRVEVAVAALVAVIMLVLVVAERDILEAPFENTRTLLFTVGGTLVAAVALLVMLRYSVPPFVRVIVLLVPFVLVNWWLISPYFRDEVVDEDFAISISGDVAGDESAGSTPATDLPVLLGAGRFVGLAGHSGSGDAGLFRDLDGSLVLRFENFDIENGPQLVVYLVPGADQTSIVDGSVALGDLKGNVGNQNYALPADVELAPGAYTALVWCDAFDVEFVGATLTV